MSRDIARADGLRFRMTQIARGAGAFRPLGSGREHDDAERGCDRRGFLSSEDTAAFCRALQMGLAYQIAYAKAPRVLPF
jgi:hypothetical protein